MKVFLYHYACSVQVISGGGVDGDRIQPPYIRINYQSIPSNSPQVRHIELYIHCNYASIINI